MALLMALVPGAEHLQHAVGHRVPADDVHGGEGHGHEGQQVAEPVVGGGGDEHGADDDDAVDRVGTGHQRGVQGRRYLADHLESDQQGEDENGEIEDHLSTCPSWVTTMAASTSSVRSFPARCAATAATLRAYAVEAAGAIAEGRLPAP